MPRSNHAAEKLLRNEVKMELTRDDSVSLKIWRMFHNKSNLLPNNRRILNMAWRIYSMRYFSEQRSSRKRHLHNKRHLSSSSVFQQDPLAGFVYPNLNDEKLPADIGSSLNLTNSNIQLLKEHDANDLLDGNKPINPQEFNYIEHIRRLSCQEDSVFGNSSKFPDSGIPSASQSYMGAKSNPIPINNSESSIESDLEFSPSLDRDSFSSSVSPYSSSGNFFGQIQKYPAHLKAPAASRQSLETTNLDDFIDFSKLEESEEDKNVDPKAYSLDNYINTLETSLNKHEMEQQRKRMEGFVLTDPSSPSKSLASSGSPPSFVSRHSSFSTTIPSTIGGTALSRSGFLSQFTPADKGEFPKNPVCENCLTSTTPLWRKTSDNHILCNACGLFFKLQGIVRPPLKAGRKRAQVRQTKLNGRRFQSQLKSKALKEHESIAHATDSDIAVNSVDGSDFNWLKFE